MRLTQKLFILATFTLILAAYVTLLPSPDVARTTLHNGLRVVVVRNGIAPVASVHVNYLVGANESPDAFPGTAHAVEHMMFRGSSGLSGEQINTILTGLGSDANATTSQHVTNYLSTISAGDLGVVLRLEAVRMRGALFAEGLWRIERGAINQEVTLHASPDESGIREIIHRKMFAGSPCSKDPLGTIDSYNRTSAAMLRQFYRQWYAPNNAVLVITGAVEPKKTLALVKSLFDDIPPRQLPPRPRTALAPLAAAEYTIPSSDSCGSVMVLFRLPGIGDKDYAAGQVLAAALAQRRSRFFDLEEQGDLLSAGFDSFAYPGVAVGYAVATVQAGEELLPKAALLKRVIDEYRQGGVPPDLVAAVKFRARLAAEGEKLSIPDQAASWSEAITSGLISPDEEQAALQQVSVADVNRVARTWLNTKTAVTVVLPAAGGRAASASGRKFTSSPESFRPTTFKPVPLPAWAETVNRLPATGTGIVPSADIRLNNGLRLIVVPAPGRLVTLSGSVKNSPDLQTPPGKEGVDRLLGVMMARGGSSKVPRRRFQETLDRLGATVLIGASFHLSCDESVFAQGLSLLADALRHPELSEKEFRTLRGQYEELLFSQNNDIQWRTSFAELKSLYPPGDPALRHERPETVRRLTLRDLEEHYATVMRPDLTTVVITGNITPARARGLVEGAFGGWQAHGPRPVTDLPPAPANRPVSLHVPEPDSKQVAVTLAHTSTLNRTHPDYYPFLVGLHVLSGSSASRLFQHVREQRGLVYGIGATLDIEKCRSTFRVTYATAPEHVARVRKLVEEDIAIMQHRPVPQDELDQAKGRMLRDIALTGSSYDSIAGILLLLAEEDLPLDQLAWAAAQVRKVTPHEVQAAFRKWIRLLGLSQITRGGM